LIDPVFLIRLDGPLTCRALAIAESVPKMILKYSLLKTTH